VNAQDDFLWKMTFWILPGSVVTLLRCGGQFHKYIKFLQNSAYQKLLK